MARQTQPFDISSFTDYEPDPSLTEWFILQFTTNAHQDFIQGSPRIDMLLNLIHPGQFNTAYVLAMNTRVMDIMSELMAPESRSWLPSDGIDVHNLLPLSLKPTHLQLTVSRRPWIDMLPLPKIRDNLRNLLRYGEHSYDKGELCCDLRGF